jgi:hypothetical protein
MKSLALTKLITSAGIGLAVAGFSGSGYAKKATPNIETTMVTFTFYSGAKVRMNKIYRVNLGSNKIIEEPIKAQGSWSKTVPVPNTLLNQVGLYYIVTPSGGSNRGSFRLEEGSKTCNINFTKQIASEGCK